MLHWTDLLVIAVLLGFNALFAAYEMALSAVSMARLHSLQKQGTRGAAAAVCMKQQIERSLAVVQLGITLMGAITGVYGGAEVGEQLAPLLERRFGLSEGAADTLALVAAVVPLAVLTIVFAELAPKVLAIRYKERVACTLSPGMALFARIAAPAVTVLEGSVRLLLALLTRLRGKRGPEVKDASSLHELQAAAALARTSKLIGAREERIVTAAAQLSSRHLREIALPAADISLIPSAMTLEEALVRAHLDMHTRFPVARDDRDPQTIEGYITFKDLIALLKMGEGATGLRAITRPLQRICGSRSIALALDEMVHGRTHIALVVDEAGHVTGMVTLEDILEELVGDIEDEWDRLPSHFVPTGEGAIVGGGVAFELVRRKFGAEAPAGAAAPAGEAAPATGNRPLQLADWIQRELGRSPHGGETIELHGLQVLVRKLRRKRLAEAFVRRAARPR
ncbi:MAG: HlyC/CorC family transporter [Planctomycetes bacterium]|nr:HlyC/CorC family transporter [Planctomycetota bacterium]